MNRELLNVRFVIINCRKEMQIVDESRDTISLEFMFLHLLCLNKLCMMHKCCRGFRTRAGDSDSDHGCESFDLFLILRCSGFK
jgi:hypothetical protein